MYRIPKFEVHKQGLSFARQLQTQKVDWGLLYTGLPELWKRSRGEKTVVYIIDDGLHIHEDLEGRVIARYKFNPDNRIDPTSWHGTFVAGIVAGIDNDKGIIGVAPDAKIVGINVFNKNLEASGDDVAKAIRFAVDHQTDRPFKVINVSLGGERPDKVVKEAIEYAKSKNVPVVCAAGNTGEETGKLDFPAGFLDSIAVGGHNQVGDPSPFSNSDSVGLTPLDCIAPAERITSCVNQRDYQQASGTSFAAPFVSGVIALMQSAAKYPMAVEDIRSILRRTAEDVAPAGYDAKTGSGRTNPIQAMEQTIDGLPVKEGDRPKPTIEENIKMNLRQLLAITINLLNRISLWLKTNFGI